MWIYRVYYRDHVSEKKYDTFKFIPWFCTLCFPLIWELAWVFVVICLSSPFRLLFIIFLLCLCSLCHSTLISNHLTPSLLRGELSGFKKLLVKNIVTRSIQHWQELQFYSIFQGLEDCIWAILCQVEYQLCFLLIMESQNKGIDLFLCICMLYNSDFPRLWHL